MSFKGYRDLRVWQLAMDLAAASYELTSNFPKAEQYGLVSQIRRAATSIPANIAEGRGRAHSREFAQFLSVAYGSLAELETHVLLAERLGYVRPADGKEMLGRSAEVGRMLNGLKRRLTNKREKSDFP